MEENEFRNEIESENDEKEFEQVIEEETAEVSVTGEPAEDVSGNDSADNADSTDETSGSSDERVYSRGRRVAAEVYSWFDTLFFPLVIIMTIFTFFVRMSRVDGTSMVPTLEDGQQLLISSFMYQPAYNDIVVVWAERLPNELTGTAGKAIVKRIVGLPGDKIKIDFSEGRIYRNGEMLDIVEKDGLLYEDGHIINDYTHWEEGLGGDFTVPEGYLFVMGDNRNGSSDSRHPWIGYIDERDVIGKAYLRVWPLNKISGLYS